MAYKGTMTRAVLMGIASLAVLLAAGACARSMPENAQLTPADAMSSIRLMQVYDSDHDGVIAKAELETGLQREFTTCDVNSDGRLNGAETQAENDRRWRASGPASSPLIDWSQDGFIDFSEFSNTARSVFGQFDRNADGRLSGAEMRPPPRGRGQGGPMPGGEGGRRG